MLLSTQFENLRVFLIRKFAKTLNFDLLQLENKKGFLNSVKDAERIWKSNQKM